MQLGPAGWATVNGGALALGFMSRIGFALWYMVPLASFMVASPSLGVLIYGSYGLLRTGLAVTFVLGAQHVANLDDAALSLRTSATTICGAILAFAAGALVIIVGL